MADSRSRYRIMERYMTAALILEWIIFIVYMIAAGNGTIWLKVLTAIFAILGSGLTIAYLYLTQEIRRNRSRWMVLAAGAVLVLTLLSLILNFPCPKPLPTV